MHSRQRLPVDRPREQHFPALGLFRGDGTAVGLGRISELGDVGGGEQRQAQCAVEGELGGAFAVAEELGDGAGQGADRREQHGGG